MQGLALITALFTTAPAFPKDLPWLNTSRPITLDELKGKVVLLDFWTYCCINCMQVIPDLKALEEKYGEKGLVVIGVHSGKFEAEKDPENIRNAMKRYEIKHPVVDDADYKIWDSFGVQAWPTLVLIGPDGEVIGQVAGEGHRKDLEQAIDKVIGKAKPGPIPGLKVDTAPTTALAFPGKIIAADKRLFIADTNHNRIVEANEDGSVVAVYEGGLKHPQGLAVDGNTLYVADTENHVVRAIDRKTKQSKVIAGTGVIGRGWNEIARGDSQRMAELASAEALQRALASPWDLARIGRTLYIANAGTHQILALDLDKGTLTVAAGSSREGIKDGDAAGAWLAQPSGLTTDGSVLYFADSEVSSVRRFDPKAGTVETLIGKGLFDFGDVDGEFAKARLQHCLGVAWVNGALYVADSYNHKVKRLDLQKKTIESLLGKLGEPGGLAVSGDALFIADTNNGRIMRYDLKTKQASPLSLRF